MLDKIIRPIDTTQDWFGFIVAFLIWPMLFITVFEVFMRYAFNSPTIWGFEATTFCYGLHFVLGLGYTYLYDGHVRVSVFVNLLKPRKQAVISLVCHLVIFLPVYIMLTYGLSDYALNSIRQLEHSWTAWAPPIYPFKALMAFGFFMLLLQGISATFKDIRTLARNEE
jgi:TRAP-type mannitol/chloroaromatic compound transport system permease small subunit